jgi:hypothetical protein
MAVPTRAQRITSIAKHSAAIMDLTARSDTTDEKLQEIDNRLAYLKAEFQPKSDSNSEIAASSGKKKKGGAGKASSGEAFENALRELKGWREDGGDEKNGEEGKKKEKRRKRRMKKKSEFQR